MKTVIRSDEEKSKLINAWFSGTSSMPNFCRARKIPLTSFYGWWRLVKHKYGERECDKNHKEICMELSKDDFKDLTKKSDEIVITPFKSDGGTIKPVDIEETIAETIKTIEIEETIDEIELEYKGMKIKIKGCTQSVLNKTMKTMRDINVNATE